MIFKRKNSKNLANSFFVNIFIGLIFFIFLSTSNLKLFANEKELSKIEDYFNSIRTLRSDFVQESDSSLISTGTFFLKKPGKFRFSYDPPIELEVVSHIQAVLIFDPRNNKTGPLTYPISGSPFKFLLKDKFEINKKSFTKIKIKNETDIRFFFFFSFLRFFCPTAERHELITKCVSLTLAVTKSSKLRRIKTLFRVSLSCV